MTHHGRPGGRLLELILGFGLIAASICVGVAVIGLSFGLCILAIWSAGRWGSGFVVALMGGVGWLIKFYFTPIWRAVYWVLAVLWRPYLRYYKYQPHSLRPLIDRED